MAASPTPPAPGVVYFVIICVTAVWVVVFLAGLITREYEPLIYASPPMGLVIGYVTGVRILRKNGNGNGS